MPARRDPRTGNWFFRKKVRLPDGRSERIFGVPTTSGLPNTRVGAEEAERRAITEILKNGELTVRKEIPTFKTFVDERWWPTYPGSVGNRQRTLEEKETHLRLHLMPVLADVRMNAIKGEIVAELFKALREKGLGEKSVKNIRTTLAKILASAKEWDVIKDAHNLPKVKPPDSKWDALTREESAALFAATVDDTELALLLFAVHTGARWGEQRAIEWGDIDWANRIVTIRRSMPHNTKKVAPTKSGRERRVPISATLFQALKAIQGIHGLIFKRRRDGGPLTLYAVRERLERALTKAGLRKIRWHDLRHSFASQLVSAGVPIIQVQAWLGHKTIVTTERYSHLTPGSGDAIFALDLQDPGSPVAASDLLPLKCGNS